jgi:uncharacterized protein YecE (DUF72 family)
VTPGTIHIGTSGWSYEHWKGPFYSRRLRSRDMLGEYAKSFLTAEINSSFYRLPAAATLESWYEATPPGFIFAAKASRYITHMKKLNDPGTSTAPFFARIRALRDKLGPILFQLPPHWGFDESRLAAFLGALDQDLRYAFEFRDRSWLNDRTFELLAERNAALCIFDLEGFLSPTEITSDLVYIRLHGPSGAYRGSYDARTLARWADTFAAWSAQGRSIYCYFDNDEAAYAARNALRLQAMLRSGGHEQVARYEQDPWEIAGAEAIGPAIREQG